MASDVNNLKKRFKRLSKPLRPLPTGTEPRLKKAGAVRFVILDFYGTLFISGVGDIGADEDLQSTEQFGDALAACGFPAGPDVVESGLRLYRDVLEKYNRTLAAGGADYPEPQIEAVWLDVLRRMKKEGLIRREVNMPAARLFSVEYEARMNPVWPMPFLNDTLAILNGLDIQTGIISNSQFYTPLTFEALTGLTTVQMGFNPRLLHWSFEEQLKKPSLAFYRGFLLKLEKEFPGTPPSEVLYVGNDMLKDIYPAAALGMKTALFAGDKRSLKWRKDDDRCRNLEPDLVITELIQLTDCVGVP